MSKVIKVNRMYELVETINQHNYNYYSLDNPTISDAEWDKLYDELVELENELSMVLPNSPTKQVGGLLLPSFKKYNHIARLYSLNKCNNFAELQNWVNGIEKQIGKQEYVIECKFDGLQMTFTYNHGVLISAATRGDGEVGEDVTLQAMQIKSVPKKINYKGEITVQGEALMRLSVLKEYNKTATEPLKNARNAAAGAIRNLDLSVVKNRNLNVFFYGITHARDLDFSTHIEILNFLQENGFHTFDYYTKTDSFNEIESFINKIDNDKNSLDILLDGAVVKLNNINLREKIGFTAKFPKWAIAFKFEAQELTTTLNNVVWQVGRTGKITPIAEIEPVELAGALIQRATLNNFGDITRKDLKLNSSVFIRRSNEVIPEILGVANHNENSIDIEKPTNCPSCNSVLVEDGANLFCRNTNGCKEQIISYLTHFVNKRAFDITGLNVKVLELLLETEHIKAPFDLFTLTKDDLLKLEGFKDRKASNLINAINKSKNIELSKFIYALGINGIGEKTAKDLVNELQTLQNIKTASVLELQQVPEIGEILAENVYNWFRNEDNVNFIENLKNVGVVVLQHQKTSPINESLHSFFNGKTVVITGKFNEFSRDGITEILESAGAKVSSSVSKNTNYLVVGENAGSKLQRAIEFDVKQITESEFLKLKNG